MSTQRYRTRSNSFTMDTEQLLAAINDAKIENLQAMERMEDRLATNLNSIRSSRT